MNKDIWYSQIFQSSIPLRNLDENKLPKGIASGCLIDYSGKRILLTVSHATGNQENWAVEIGYEKNKGTISYQLGAMWFLRGGSILDLHFKDIDFSYVEVPSDLIAFRQELDFKGNVKKQVQLNVFSPDFDVLPSIDEQYGFSGSVMPSIESHNGQVYFFSEFKVYAGLKYLRKEDEFYVFKLPFTHPGHEHFKGCSGAPIIDTSGKVIALVCSGNEQTNEIYGIAISKYRVALDILVGNV
ncbi:hypothetical protein [Aeromonas allosaccharophila]|uniref:hypothetical protein n=1 Tax=Aeromonas allosaccharophila TaxID=656 RepID=UPI0013A6B981|nr:hypothetical protein [Aeromonas allosaccharophila]